MVINAVKLFFFVVGGTAAAAGTAYVTGVLDPYLPGARPSVVAETPQPQASQEPAAPQPASAETPSVEAAASRDAADAEPDAAAQEQAAPAPAAGAVLPTFDLLRVEPDGSLVIAGHAPPSSSVEAFAGSSAIGTTPASESGDFVLVLDEPLRPGDYTIRLRATGPDDETAVSEETAVVSVPDREDGQVLALVEQPGAPSRLINVPEPASAPDGDGQPTERGIAFAGGQPAASEPQHGLRQEEADLPPAEPEAGGSAAGAPAAPEDAPADMAAREASREDAAAPGPQQPTPVTAEAAPEAPPAPWPSREDAAASAQPAPAGSEAEAAEVAADPEPAQRETAVAAPEEAAPDAAPARTAAAPDPSRQDATAPQRQSAPAVPEAAPAPTVVVEVVEIEGRKIFVAGVADADSRVRVYANEHLLGEAVASPNGRFLVEAERDMPVGEYLIRADLLGPDGATVVARAVVPFEREPGEQVAAVAPRTEPRAPASEPQPQAARPDEAPLGEPQRTPRPDAGESAAAPAVRGPAEPAIAREEPAAGEAADDVAEVTAARLEPVEGSVIIRRGDTLWHISRRVYGRGVRYSTIYLANQDQIADPDRIWPGQIFSLPGETEQGEPADLSTIADRVSPADPR